MQFSNEGLTSRDGRLTGRLDRPESDARDARAPQSECAVIHSAMALPIAGPESSWMKCEPGTVTSRWFFQLRQNSRTGPTRIAPGSALTNSLGRSLWAIQSA